jgi:ribosome maturation factor RimP
VVAIDPLAGRLAPTVHGLGYELLGIERGTAGGGTLVRLYIDREEGIGIEDCEIVSRQIGDLLDVEDLIPGEYTLEVSSPGIDRPLFTREQFQAHVGEAVKLRLRTLVDGRRRLAGTLVRAEEELVTIQIGEELIDVAYNVVEKARLDPQWQ